MRKYPALLPGNFAVLLAAVVCATAQTWQLDPAFAPSFVNEVPAELDIALAPTADGRVLAYGNFTHNNGTATTGLLRLRADGTVDSSFAPNMQAGSYLNSVAPLPDGRALAVVTLPTSSGSTQTNFVRLLADGRLDPTYPPLAVNSTVTLTRLPSGAVLAWGFFSSIGGSATGTYNGLARFAADGTLDPSFAPTFGTNNVSVRSIAVQADGRVFVSAATSSTSPVYFLWRLLPTGARDSSFAPPPPIGTYDLLAVQPDGKLLTGKNPSSAVIIVSGAITTGDTAAATAPGCQLSRFNADGTPDTSFQFQLTDAKRLVSLAALADGRIAVEAQAGPASVSVYILNAAGAVVRDLRQTLGADHEIHLLAAADDGNLLLRHGLPMGAVTTLSTAVPVDPAVITSPVESIVMPILYPSSPRHRLAQPQFVRFAIDTAATVSLALAPTRQETSSVSLSRVFRDDLGRILVAGTFTHVNGQPRFGLVRFAASGAIDPAYVSNVRDSRSRQLLCPLPDGHAVVSETYLGARGADGIYHTDSRLVRLQADGSLDPAFAGTAELTTGSAQILAAASDGRLLVAKFDPDDTREENLKLVWLGTDGRRLSTLPTTFQGFPGNSTEPVVPVTPLVADATATTTAHYYFRFFAAQLLADGRILLGGAFDHVNGVAVPRLVRLNADGSLDSTYNATILSSAAPINYALALADGSALVNYYVSTNTGYAYLRLRPDGSRDPAFVLPPAPAMTAWRELPGGLIFGDSRFWYGDGRPCRNFTSAFQYASTGGNGTASDAAVAQDSSLWICGRFGAIDGQPRQQLARWVSTETVAITVPPSSQTVLASRDVYFQVDLGTSHAATYQWYFNGVPLAGATHPWLVLPGVRADQAGSYAVRVTVDGRVFDSTSARLDVAASNARLSSFSGRSRVTPGSPQILGLVMRPGGPNPALLRSVGRGLGTFLSLDRLLNAPVLTLYDRDQPIAENRGTFATGISDVELRVGAFSPLWWILFPDHPAIYRAGLVQDLAGDRAYTTITTSGDESSGLCLAECYDASTAAVPVPVLRNASVRGRTGAEADVLIAGFVIKGQGPLRLLVRGVGPTLAQFGVSNAVADPSLAIYRAGGGLPIASNDDWGGAADVAAAALRTGAFPLPAGSKDAALILTLDPGVYTLHLTAADAAGGEALVELYTIDP